MFNSTWLHKLEVLILNEKTINENQILKTR